eukprot:scaffold103789_cov60-Phaeocystis_antarctica.AAC.3
MPRRSAPPAPSWGNPTPSPDPNPDPNPNPNPNPNHRRTVGRVPAQHPRGGRRATPTCPGALTLTLTLTLALALTLTPTLTAPPRPAQLRCALARDRGGRSPRQ